MKSLELKLAPLVLVLSTGLAMYGCARLISDERFVVPMSKIIVGGIALVGTMVIFAGQSALRKHDTTVNPLVPESASSVVTTGIYGYTRNPIYLGMLLWLLAFGIHIGSYVALLWLPLFVAYVTRFQIVPEERALSNKFGEPFVTYMKSVRRWI